MDRDALLSSNVEGPRSSSSLTAHEAPRNIPPRMQYRSRPVTVAVDPVSLVISECISITSAIQKHARLQHSSVSAILGGSPNPIHLGPPSPSLRGRSKSPSEGLGGDGALDSSLTNRWGLRGQKGKSMQDNPMIAGFGKLRHELAGIKGEARHSRAMFVIVNHLLVLQISIRSTPLHFSLLSYISSKRKVPLLRSQSSPLVPYESSSPMVSFALALHGSSWQCSLCRPP